jgi:hypothetical protein
MCPRPADEWRADADRKRRIHILGPVAWVVAVALSVAAIALFVLPWLVVLFDWGGSGAWLVVAIALASIGFVAAASAALTWLSRRRKPTERTGGPTEAKEHAGAGAWLSSLIPHRDPLVRPQSQSRRETSHRLKPTEFQWVLVFAFIAAIFALMLFFRTLWIPGLETP